MATTVIDTYADQLQAYVESGTKMDTNLSICKTVVIPFIHTCSAEASGSDIALAIIPKGARIISGEIVSSATLANSAQISIGLAGKDGTGTIDDVRSGSSISTAGATVTSAQSDSTTCLKAAAVQSTTKVGFALTPALGFLYEAQKDLYLTATTSVGAVTTEVLRGYVIVAYP